MKVHVPQLVPIMTQTIVVTGASEGIGLAITQSLLMRGFRVVGVARSEEKLRLVELQKFGRPVGAVFEYVVGDIAKESTIVALLQLATRDGHAINGLILNAAILGPVKAIMDTKPEEIEHVMMVNFISAFSLCQKVIPILQAHQGKILVLTSGAVEYPTAGLASYCCSKAALNALVAVLARENPHITVAGIRPGLVETAMSAKLMEQSDKLSPEQLEFLSKTSKLDPSEVGSKLADLMSKNRTESISGEILDLNEAISLLE